MRYHQPTKSSTTHQTIQSCAVGALTFSEEAVSGLPVVEQIVEQQANAINIIRKSERC